MKYHWQSKTTGEIVSTLKEVITTIKSDFKHYKFLNLIWKYSMKGF